MIHNRRAKKAEQRALRKMNCKTEMSCSAARHQKDCAVVWIRDLCTYQRIFSLKQCETLRNGLGDQTRKNRRLAQPVDVVNMHPALCGEDIRGVQLTVQCFYCAMQNHRNHLRASTFSAAHHTLRDRPQVHIRDAIVCMNGQGSFRRRLSICKLTQGSEYSIINHSMHSALSRTPRPSRPPCVLRKTRVRSDEEQ